MAGMSTQSDLRRMMSKMKSTDSKDRLKKYKLSSKEVELMRQMKASEEEPAAKRRPPVPNADARPAKSILKNTSATATYTPPAIPSSSAATTVPVPLDERAAVDERAAQEEASKGSTESANGKTDLPEGFFDDPIQDAKARHVEYKDPGDEEWERFQKEIAVEIDTSQEKVAEELQEVTAERQIDEIDDQMRAWNRVSAMEKRLALIEKISREKRANREAPSSADSDESDDNQDEDELNWRKKC